MDTSYYVDTTYGVSQTTGLLSLIAGIGIFIWILGMALSIFFVVAMWKVFVKAGKPGWAALIPIYNIYIMCEIAEKEWWYILLLCVPILNIYAIFVIYDGIAKKFGKTTGFTIGMMFLPYIFFPILAFGKNNNVESTSQPIANENADINNNYTANTVQDINNTQPSNNINQSINMVDTSNSPVQNVVPGVGLQEQQIIEPNVVQPAMMGAEPVAEQMTNVAPTFENNVNQVENMVDTSNSPVQNVVPEVETQEQQNVQPVVDNKSETHTSLWSNNNNNQ